MAIKAPSKVPHKQGLGVAFEVAGLLAWTGVAIIASQFIVGYLMVLLLGVDSFDKPVVTAVFSALSYTLAVLLVVWVPPKLMAKWRQRHKTHGGKATPKMVSRTELGLRGSPTWTDIGLAPVGFIVYFLLAAGLTAIFNQFTWFDANEVQDVGFNNYLIGIDRLIAFVTLVVVAPVAEEVIFRGWLYGKLRTKLTAATNEIVSMVVSILLVSLLFGLIHGQWNVGVNVFAMSIVLCALREITGTIYAGILLHMLKNGVAFYLLYVVGFGA